MPIGFIPTSLLQEQISNNDLVWVVADPSGEQ